MTSGDAAALADVLAKRRDVLAGLCDGVVRKRTLVETLGVPRTTLDRAVRELVDAGLVERADGGFTATGVGETALATHDRYHRRLDGLAAGATLFDHLPAETPLDGQFLADATVETPDPTIPDSVIGRLFDSISDAACVEGIAPVALSGHIDTFDAEATAAGTPPAMVLSPAVLDHILDTRRERVLELLEAEEMRYFCGSMDVAFGLWIATYDDRDDEAGVVVYTDTGVGGVAVNDTTEAVDWARAQFDRVRDSADRVTIETVREWGDTVGADVPAE